MFSILVFLENNFSASLFWRRKVLTSLYWRLPFRFPEGALSRTNTGFSLAVWNLQTSPRNTRQCSLHPQITPQSQLSSCLIAITKQGLLSILEEICFDLIESQMVFPLSSIYILVVFLTHFKEKLTLNIWQNIQIIRNFPVTTQWFWIGIPTWFWVEIPGSKCKKHLTIIGLQVVQKIHLQFT